MPSLGIETIARIFRDILSCLEDGLIGKVEVTLELPLERVLRLTMVYDLTKLRVSELQVSSTVLNDEQWRWGLKGDKILLKYLHSFVDGFSNEYERMAFEESETYDDFERNKYHSLLKLSLSLPDFDEMYLLRKNLVANCDEKYLANYVKSAKLMGTCGIYYLPDNTLLVGNRIKRLFISK